MKLKFTALLYEVAVEPDGPNTSLTVTVHTPALKNTSILKPLEKLMDGQPIEVIIKRKEK